MGRCLARPTIGLCSLPCHRLTAPAARLTTAWSTFHTGFKGPLMYKAVTRGISVTVTPRYLPEESSPEDNRYFFAYMVEIINTGLERVQLRARYWRITDEHGRVQEVRGAGVVGEEPVLGPGESYSYTSGCPLTTPSGTMEGSYAMETAAGETFDAAIPAFSLDMPRDRRVLH